MPKSIVWLASYPKSGNTWLRLFLFNYLFDMDKPAPINQAHRIGPSDSTANLYYQAAGKRFDISDMRQTLRHRRKVIGTHAGNGADVNFMKTHNANLPVEGTALIPAEHTRGAIYVIRDPADMLVSFAHHFSTDTERAAEAIANESHTIRSDKDGTIIPQYLGSWSEHVRSWTNDRRYRTHAIRYEDMQAEPEKTFGGVLDYIGAPTDPARLEKAIRFSSFDEARKQETEYGFVEKPKAAASFFRSGKVGEGRATLPPDLIARIERDHGEVMRRFGYL